MKETTASNVLVNNGIMARSIPHNRDYVWVPKPEKMKDCKSHSHSSVICVIDLAMFYVLTELATSTLHLFLGNVY